MVQALRPARLARPALPIALALVTAASPASGQSLTLTFEPESSEFDDATHAYRELWASEGQAIVRALESASGMTFPVESVIVTVMEGPSWAGRDRMGMRASYPLDTKRATLAHELGHILIGDRIPEDADGEPTLDHHDVLFLFLYEVWVELWGEDFAREQVEVESRRRGPNDYEGRWNRALSLGLDGRRDALASLLEAWRS
jgi:hypothetical protein